MEHRIHGRVLVGALAPGKRKQIRDSCVTRIEGVKRRRQSEADDSEDCDELLHICASHLWRWQMQYSWTCCTQCKSVVPCDLSSHHFRDEVVHDCVTSCASCRSGYVVPQPEDIPPALRHLSAEIVCALRPFVMHQGSYFKPHAAGLRRHAEVTKLRWKPVRVVASITALNDGAKQLATVAFNFLMDCDASSYREFVHRHDAALNSNQGGHHVLMSNLVEPYLECALWPDIYWKRDLCDSRWTAEGIESRRSCKASFLVKVLSPIVDYGSRWELLQWQYDRFIISRFSGRAAANRHMSLKWLLKDIPESPQYLHIRRGALVDLTEQHGLPDLMFTYAPGLYSLSWPQWIEQERIKSGLELGSGSIAEVLHIRHLLDSIVHHFLLGEGVKDRKHLPFFDARNKRMCIKAYADRAEFQDGIRSRRDGQSLPYHGTGMEHRHILVWLDEPFRSNALRFFRADLPRHDNALRVAVIGQQLGDTDSVPRVDETEWDRVETPHGPMWSLKLEHSEMDHVRGRWVQPYCVPLALAYIGHQHILSISKDQACRAYLAKMCAYVVKGETCESAPTGIALAAAFLRRFRPSAAQMVRTLQYGGSFKISQNLKEVALDPPDQCMANDTFQKYLSWARREIAGSSSTIPTLNFKEWLRSYRTDIAEPRLYKRTKHSAAVLSIHFAYTKSDTFCGQWLLANVPCTDATELIPNECLRVPTRFKWFTACLQLAGNVWNSDEALQRMLERMGLPRDSIQQHVLHWRSQRDLVALLLSGGANDLPCDTVDANMVLSNDQKDIFNTLMDTLDFRDKAFEEGQLDARGAACFLTGPPGSGKSHVAVCFAEINAARGRHVLIVSPTGAFAEIYRRRFLNNDLVTIGTFDSALGYHDKSSFRFLDFTYDIVIVDEIGYIDKTRANYIWQLWLDTQKFALLLAIGDFQQLQPPGGESCEQFIEKSFRSFTLSESHRSDDPILLRIQKRLRKFTAKVRDIDALCLNSVLLEGAFDTHWDDIDNYIGVLVDHFKRHPTTYFLAVQTSVVEKLNSLLINTIFGNENPLGSITIDFAQRRTMAIYHGLRVMITANINKSYGMCNGATGSVIGMTRNQVSVQLDSGEIVGVHWYRSIKGDRCVTGFPLAPTYCVTVAKVLGRTLPSVSIVPDLCMPACGYVAISRVASRKHIWWVYKPDCKYFKPLRA